MNNTMGSIYYINTNPELWAAYLTQKKLKQEYGGEQLYNVRYGALDDEEGCVDLEILMRESVYHKVMTGEYKVSPNSKYKRELVIIDKNGTEITPVSRDFCY